MKKLYAILLFFFLATASSASYGNDNEGWSSITLALKPMKAFALSLRQELRMKDDLSTVDQYFTQLAVDFRLFKGAKIGAGVRFIRNNDTKGKIQGYENHVRVQLDAKYSFKVARFRLGFRLRYQNKNELDKAEEEYGNQHLRFKTSVKYNIRKWKLDPILSGELYYGLSEGNEEAGFDKWRITIGTQYKLGRAGKIGLFYRREGSIGQEESEQNNIIILRYGQSF